MNRSIRFGVNYTFSKNWLYSWVDWDRSSVRSDIQALANLGFDHIRIHLIWSVFQPNANYVSETCLQRLHQLMDIADECNIDVVVCVLDGGISGFTFYPSWKKDRNMFTDPYMIEAEKHLFSAIASHIGTHKRFLGFDLGNEVNGLFNLEGSFCLQEGDSWHRELINHCEDIAPGKFHVNGVDHRPWFSDQGFSRSTLATTGAATSLHTWIEFTGALELYRHDENGCIQLAEYCVELANAYATSPNRPVWVQEFGVNELWIPEADLPAFTESTIRNAITSNNIWGFTWWCSHDLDPRFEGFEKLEYPLGILDLNNRPKPVGLKLAELIQEFKLQPPEVVDRPIAIVFPDHLFEEVKSNSVYANNQGWNFAKPYFDFMKKEGIRPAIVLESKINDEAYLRSRGIREIQRLL
ncbi:MAG: cellulase family glycosylhydrolase [Gorillibacterium sp.]|nr:cellulase family glycosylhydrolase [Gorillibacterium sp.]